MSWTDTVAVTTQAESGPLAKWRARVMALGAARGGLAAMALGAVGALGFAPLHAWPATIVAYTGFIWLMDAASQREAPAMAGAWRGWCFGVGHYLSGLWWVGNAFLSRGSEFAPYAVPGAVALAALLALFWAAAGGVLAANWRADWRRIALFAATIGTMEFLRGNILSGFPWNLPAYVWVAGGPVSQSASIIGVYGLSLVTLFAFAAPAALGGPDRRVRERVAPLLAGLAAFGVIVVWGVGRLSVAGGPDEAATAPDVRLRIVQAQISQAQKWLPSNRDAVTSLYLDLTSRPGLDDRTHVIWPESALPVFLLEEPRVLDAVANTLSDTQSLYAGAIRRSTATPLDADLFNSFVALTMRDTAPIVSAIYDKHRLVPFGEFIPAARLGERLGFAPLGRLGEGFTAGQGAVTIHTPGAPSFSPQICYESVFPGFTPRGADRPSWILNITNDAWYGDSPGPRQSFNQSRYRAIEEGLPLVRSASGGVSAVVDPFGRVVASLPMSDEGVLDADLPLPLPPSLYGLTGEAVFLFMLLLSFGSAVGRAPDTA